MLAYCYEASRHGCTYLTIFKTMWHANIWFWYAYDDGKDHFSRKRIFFSPVLVRSKWDKLFSTRALVVWVRTHLLAFMNVGPKQRCFIKYLFPLLCTRVVFKFHQRLSNRVSENIFRKGRGILNNENYSTRNFKGLRFIILIWYSGSKVPLIKFKTKVNIIHTLQRIISESEML